MSKQTSTPNEIVGERVRGLRTQNGWSADDLAARMGDALGRPVQHYIVNRIENGSRPTTADEIGVLAEIFEVKPGVFFEANSQLEARQMQLRSLERDYVSAVQRLKDAARELLQVNDKIDAMFWSKDGRELREKTKHIRKRRGPAEIVSEVADEHDVMKTVQIYGAQKVRDSLKPLNEEPPF